MRATILAFVVLLAGCGAAPVALPAALAAARPAMRDEGMHDPRVDKLFAAWNNARSPGAAVAVVQDGKVRHLAGYGMADLASKRAIDADTVFDLASVSKQFTAWAVMILADRGKLALDDPLRKWLPKFPAYANKVTVRHLLHHTGGLPDYGALYEDAVASGHWAPGFRPNQAQIVDLIAAAPGPDFAAGAKYEYSNSGYCTLARIVEEAAGEPFGAFMAREVFGPLGMKATRVVDRVPAGIAAKATTYHKQGGAWKPMGPTPLDGLYGDGNVHTTLPDMLRWVAGLERGALVSKAMDRLAHTEGKTNAGKPIGYGFGVGLGLSAGEPYAGHAGSWNGFNTELLRFRHKRWAMVVLMNDDGADPDAIAHQFAEAHPWNP